MKIIILKIVIEIVETGMVDQRIIGSRRCTLIVVQLTRIVTRIPRINWRIWLIISNDIIIIPLILRIINSRIIIIPRNPSSCDRLFKLVSKLIPRSCILLCFFYKKIKFNYENYFFNIFWNFKFLCFFLKLKLMKEKKIPGLNNSWVAEGGGIE